MGPPGEKPTIPITPHMKEVMKGLKGDHGKIGDPGFTGPRGNFTHIIIILIYYSMAQRITYFMSTTEAMRALNVNKNLFIW